MASPCQILFDAPTDADRLKFLQLAQLAQQEAFRIEHKFSRYCTNNLIYKINHSNAKPIQVDDEFKVLFDYAQTCYEISEGNFDITSGILSQAWKFDCSDNIPSQSTIDPLLKNIGWNKVTWQAPFITLKANMQIDLGGIGKEYAVDRTAEILSHYTKDSFLINYGGDIFVNKPRNNNQAWLVGIEDPQNPTAHFEESITKSRNSNLFELSQGGMATSGDSKRYLLKDGVRYSHILNPKTGWPITKAPHSITVVASTCTEAGILSTLAMLEEENAKEFLEEQEVVFWCSE